MSQNRKQRQSSTRELPAAASVLRRIEASGDRIWRMSDFDGLPVMAVSQALSRLSRRGVLQRLGKGLYYRPRATAFGPSQPNPNALRQLTIAQRSVFPAGLSAANLLGFTTQNPARVEVSTNGTSLPRLLMGHDTIIHTRRPDTWRDLSEADAAILDFLRHRGETSELSSGDTVDRLLQLIGEPGRLKRLMAIAHAEPPRVRAMLGAIARQLGWSESRLASLRQSLNPLSRFDFGKLNTLQHARDWQARDAHETV